MTKQVQQNRFYGFSPLTCHIARDTAANVADRRNGGRQPVRERQSESRKGCARSRHEVLRTGIVFLSLLVGMSVHAGDAAQRSDQQEFDIDIPALNAAKALTMLAEQTDSTLLFPYKEAWTRQANVVIGRYALPEALSILLQGSGLRGSLSDDGVIRISLVEDARPNKREGGTSMKLQTKRGFMAAVIGTIIAAAGVKQTAAQEGAVPQQQGLQAPPSALEEVIVTAQRREESLQDIPISASVLTADVIDRNMIEDVGDYLPMIPNVSFTTAGARDEREIAIRGIANNLGQIDRAAQTLGLYVDGFSVNLVTNNPHLQDADRIEVLRGPQGTFFGRGASGGAINITRKQPGPDFFAEADAQYGRDATWSVAGTVNTPVIEDRLYLRANAYNAHSDGFVTNVNPAGGRSDSDYQYSRLASRWLITDRFVADLTVTHTNEEHGIEALIASGVMGPFGRSIYRGAPPVLDGLAPYPTNTTTLNHDLPSSRSNEYYTATANLNYDFGNFAVTSITGYIERDFNRISDVDHTSLDFIRQEWEEHDTSFSEELRIVSNRDGRWDWLIGGFFASDRNRIPVSRVSVGADNFFGAPPGRVIFSADRSQEINSWAAFGQINFRPTDRLTLTAGGRYSTDDIEKFDSTATPTNTRSASFTDFSPHFAVSYDVTDDLMVYGTVSQGYKPGGLQLDPRLPRNTYDEELIRNYELGFKSHFFDRRFRINAAAFLMDWSDMQVNNQVAIQDPNTGAFVIIRGVENAAEATTKGFEFDMSALLAPGLQVGASAGYLDAKFDSYPNAFLTGGLLDLSGERLPQAPEWTSTAHVQYATPIRSGAELFISGEWSYRSETVPNVQNLSESGFPFRAPAFDVWNFRVGYVSKRFSIFAYLENAFDEQYFTTSADNGFLSGVGIQPSRRTYGIRVKVQTGE